MILKLQKNNSENNSIYKDVDNIISLEGTLREETSILDPVIMVEASLENLVNANYATIPIFNRKYFITDIVSIRKNLVEIHMHVDVLSSYSSEILNLEAVVNRQENEYNLYLNDASYRVYQNPIIQTKSFPQGFNTQEFVLVVAGGQ